MVGKPEGRDNSLKRMPDKEKSNGGSKDCLKSTSFWPKVGRRLNKLSFKKLASFRLILRGRDHLVKIVFFDICLPSKIEEDFIP